MSARSLATTGIILSALSCTVTTLSGAQRVSTLDIGASSVRYADDYTATAMSITPAIQWERGAATLFGLGTLSRFETGELSSSAVLAASYLTNPRDRLRAEFAVSGAGNAHEDGSRTGLAIAQLRAHVALRGAGLWVGGSGGRAWNMESARGASALEAGGWWRHGTLVLTGSVAPWRAGEHSWTEVAGAARWTRGPLEASAMLGVRSGGDASDRGAWGGIDGAWWITRHVAVSGSAGRNRADLLQGMPGGRYLTLGVRLATRSPLMEIQRLRGTPPASRLARPVAGRIAVTGTGARRTIRLDADRAQVVEIMGDFTEWRPVRLAPARGSEWEITLPLAAGSHRFNIRIDGGDWGVPDGVTAITDDFDGVVGILNVR